MASISANWIGVSAVVAAFEKVGKQADLASRAIVAKMAAEVEKAAKANFEGSHKRGEPHVGGNKPNVVSGDLRRSITHEPITKGAFMEWKTSVGPTMVYGRRVELGGVGGGRSGTTVTKPYPYFVPAADAARAKFGAIAAAEWAAFLRL